MANEKAKVASVVGEFGITTEHQWVDVAPGARFHVRHVGREYDLELARAPITDREDLEQIRKAEIIALCRACIDDFEIETSQGKLDYSPEACEEILIDPSMVHWFERLYRYAWNERNFRRADIAEGAKS